MGGPISGTEKSKVPSCIAGGEGASGVGVATGVLTGATAGAAVEAAVAAAVGASMGAAAAAVAAGVAAAAGAVVAVASSPQAIIIARTIRRTPGKSIARNFRHLVISETSSSSVFGKSTSA